MSIQKINAVQLQELSRTIPVLDVRSPGEYNHAHIPGAFSFPIFNDDERKEIGTAYKQVDKETAVKIGLASFGPNMVKMVGEAEKILALRKRNNETKELIVHCWRGGLRSAAVAWLLDLYGINVYLLTGGYKAYRKWVLSRFDLPFEFHVLGGYTGSGKTETLHELKKKGYPVIDLEKLAGHKGSAFGNLDLIAQPGQEMFENSVAEALHKNCPSFDGEKLNEYLIIWIEDESARIGNLNLPVNFYNRMQEQPLFFLKIPFKERLEFIVKNYGGFPREKLVNAILRIQKKLGGLDTKVAINLLLENDVAGSFSILLAYYDKLYKRAMVRPGRKVIEILPVSIDPIKNAALIEEFKRISVEDSK